MILPDINLLLHAYNSESPVHAGARLVGRPLSGRRRVALARATILGFVRVATHRQIFANPLAVAVACAHVRGMAWSALGQRHRSRGASCRDPLRLLESLGTAGNLTTDAHLAALAIEHQAELHSTDADFTRFPGLRWVNPLA